MNFHHKSTESQKCYGLFTPWEETRKPRSGRRPFVWASFCFRQRRPLCKQPKYSSDHCTPRSDVFAHSHIPLSYMCTRFLWYCPKIFNQLGPPRAFPSCSDAKSWQQIYPHVGQAVGKGLTVGWGHREKERKISIHKGISTESWTSTLCFDFRETIIFASKWKLRAQLPQHRFWNQITGKVKAINMRFRKRENTRQNLQASWAERCPLDLQMLLFASFHCRQKGVLSPREQKRRSFYLEVSQKCAQQEEPLLTL